MGVRIIPVEEFLKLETVTTYYATSGSGGGVVGGLDPTSVTAWQDGSGRTFVGGEKDPSSTFDNEITFSDATEQSSIVPAGTVEIRISDDDVGASTIDNDDVLTIEFLDSSGSVISTITGQNIQPDNTFGGGEMGSWVNGDDLQFISLNTNGDQIPDGTDQIVAIGPMLSGYLGGDTLTLLDNGNTGSFDLPLCFVNGTQISTPQGPVAIEDLKVGETVLTTGGKAPIRWVGKRKLYRRELAKNPKLYPVRIMAKSLGSGLPKCDLLVSRQHRILVSSKIAERMFGQKDVLVPAIKLTEVPGIYVDETVDEFEYFHLLFDSHKVVFAEGAPAESLFTGREALKAVSPQARQELLAIFPDMGSLEPTPNPAAFIPAGGAQKRFVERHLKNSQPFLPTC